MWKRKRTQVMVCHTTRNTSIHRYWRSFAFARPCLITHLLRPATTVAQIQLPLTSCRLSCPCTGHHIPSESWLFLLLGKRWWERGNHFTSPTELSSSQRQKSPFLLSCADSFFRCSLYCSSDVNRRKDYSNPSKCLFVRLTEGTLQWM